MRMETHQLAREGAIPNSSLPLAIFRGALPQELDGAGVCGFLKRNGWGGTWLDGIYPFWHFHTHGHEVLACVAGEARVGFGGDNGVVARIAKGDVCVIPAGVGHKRVDCSPGFRVAGAYPPGQEGNIVRPNDMPDERAACQIAGLALPDRDPVTGRDDGVVALWRKAGDG